ncbi:nicotinate phosphoribosyltransferase [Parvibium lacunae]|uniref:Nicotinamide phosphoribosyltransferase n=1 Tax=Parvibium lacunae TaxID=1888893 RepID=A0A368L7T5_9BURK|nr:nicotinate phosphoribosyltransferase [Parvibium lacunae]RCS59686.1 nicotinate phosphoribosyltransferase [Parvibium lacunae]
MSNSILNSFTNNLILNTDSYKASHWEQYRSGTCGMFSYIESRGGEYDKTVFFGLQSILKEYLSQPITREMVEQAKLFFLAHGEPFNEAAWLYIIDSYQGFLPVTIKAVPEGTVVPTKNVLMTIECTDPKVFWVASYLETLLLRVWYPITVATVSWHIKQVIREYLDKTSDDPAGQIAFKLHDFGARGVSSTESSAIGGMAHLVNFMGSDTVLGVMAANQYYNEPMAAFSIPAAEHSTITSWGREGELSAYRNMLNLFAKPNALLAVVSDSYDLFGAIDKWGTELRQQIIDSGAMLVIRPDSGDPAEIVLATAQRLDGYFGSTKNGKGYKVLNHVRIIQGDGVCEASIRDILTNLERAGFAADNVAFGMGGALLQRMDRDTQRFAMKCSAVKLGEQWIEVYKDPITDPGKTSKRGRLSLYRHKQTGEYRTIKLADQAAWSDKQIETVDSTVYEEVLVEVWKDGQLLKEWNLAAIRARAAS